MKFAAFFRNLNLGRANCPSKAQFEKAFTAAGADAAASFLTNGTLVYASASSARARKVLVGARAALRTEYGLVEPAFIRSVDHLAELVALDPYAALERDSVYQCCISFLQAGSGALPALPLQSRRGDVEVFRLSAGEAFSISRKIGNTPGSPNAFLERLLGAPVTTRNWNTVVRLVRKHA